MVFDTSDKNRRAPEPIRRRSRVFKDLRMLELAERKNEDPVPSRLVAVPDCIQTVTEIPSSERRTMYAAYNKARRFFESAVGGSYAIFKQRPPRKDFVQYSVDSVRYLVELWEEYQDRAPFQTATGGAGQQDD